MVDYATLNPVVIDTLAFDVATDVIPMYFGASKPCDLYWQGQLVATSVQALWTGVAITVLPRIKYPHNLVADDTTKLRVSLIYGNPETCTNDQFLQGQNVCYVGGQGRWECVYYRDVTDNGDGTVTLSHLLRAQRSSYYAAQFHQVKDTVVFESGALVRFDRPLSEIDTTITNKIVPAGQSSGTATGLGGPLYVYPFNLKPWAPVNPKLTVSGTDRVFSWTRVDRAPSTMHDGDDFTPLTDSPESYTIDIYKLPVAFGDLPVRSVTGLTTPSYTYSAADRTADGTDALVYYIVVTQDSVNAGRGWPLVAKVYK